ncbi:hypothetical protein GCM10009415_33310 [Chitinophaga japonensis]
MTELFQHAGATKAMPAMAETDNQVFTKATLSGSEYGCPVPDKAMSCPCRGL